MGTRLAEERDLSALRTMLENMGQLWSDEAIIERLNDPKGITMLHTAEAGSIMGTAREVVDGFCMSYSHSAQDASFGPMDYNTDDVAVWIKAIIEMAFSMAWVPSIVGNVDNQLLRFRIWPGRPGLRTYAQSIFQIPRWRRRRAWQPSDGNAYVVEEDGSWTFHVRRDWLLQRGAQILAS